MIDDLNNKKTRLHHRHLLFERGSSRDCGANDTNSVIRKFRITEFDA